jgi:hypothetical protein
LDPKTWTPRAAAFLRVAVVQLWRVDRGHLAPGRTLKHRCDGKGLPQGTAPGPNPRSADHE